MRKICGLFIALLMLTACGGNKTTEAESVSAVVDSIQKVDSVQDSTVVEETPPPAAADGIFDDFSYNFMRNKSFQKQRIKFPLEWIDNGEKKTIAANEWKFTPLYSKRDVYTILFDNEKSMSNATDTAVKQVDIELISVKKQSVKQYHFDKLNGAWMLTRITTQPVKENVNGDFLTFYARFAKDKKFQQQSVAATFQLSVVDQDTEERITGTGDAAQWFSYSPEFPYEEITNINYGQKYADNGIRVLVVSSTDGALSSTITFKKKGNKWMATKIENN